jgi:N-methylhydantoinase A
MTGLCIGVDVGGTFTDAVLATTDGQQIWRAKSPTTPDDVSIAVIEACSLASERSGSSLDAVLPRVARFGLGTTAVTNAVAARQGRRVGLLTTRGFEQMLRLARGRVVGEGGWLHQVPQLVADDAIVGIDERIDCTGAVLRRLEPEEVSAAARVLVEERGVEALAVSFLWSFVNPDHEAQALEAVAQAFPDLPVSSGAALLPVVREYERTALAVLNAFAGGAFVGIASLATELARRGLEVPVLLVHSGGGTISVHEARARPAWLVESGPAAGVAAAAAAASASGVADCITCDMGGTSFDVSDVTGGMPSRIGRGELMGISTALPRVDVESIGAGGGSVGWVDARAMLRVGPRSAGSAPGPACYGRGGTEATITDALVVLGYIDPERFLGGTMVLDHAAALRACSELGRVLGFDGHETAWGIREIALAEMTKAVRARLALRGLDPRSYPLLSYGGCASLFTPEIALALQCPMVVVPALAPVLSAFGAAISDVRRERTRAVLANLPVDTVVVEKIYAELRSEVEADLAADGVEPNDRFFGFEADLRFVRQIHEITVPFDASFDDDGAALRGRFHAEYARRYGQGSIMLGTPVELVSLRAVGTGATVKVPVEGSGNDERALRSTPSPCRIRAVRRAREAERVDVDVHDGETLRPGHCLTGPALIDSDDTTVWVPSGARVRVDAHHALIMEVP